MKQPGRWLPAELGAHRTADRVDVPRHVGVVVVGRLGDWVAAVAAHVERDDVEVREKPAPEIDIAVDREPVAVAEEEPDRGQRIAVPAHNQDRAAGVLDRDFGQRRRECFRHQSRMAPRPG